MTKQIKTFPNQIIAALIGFGAIGAGLVALIPQYDLTQYLGWFGASEQRIQLGATAYAIMMLTAGLLWFVRKLLKLPLSWFLYTCLFNGLIVLVKFVSSPNTYSKLATTTLVVTTVAVGLIYIAGAWLVYLFTQGKILKSLNNTAKNSNEVKLLFAAGSFVFINFLRIVIFSLPFLAKTPTSVYLGSIFKGGGLILSITLFLIIFGTVEAFDRAKHDRALLRNLFILEVTMLVIYHVLWAIFVKNLGSCGC